MGKRVGLGMNEFELKENKQIDEYTVRNLNKEPTLPYPDASFDVVTCVVSVDYLNKPLEIFKEVSRVLRPGALLSLRYYCLCSPSATSSTSSASEFSSPSSHS